ncbi:MAG: L-seryl-tRNA selenium transferase [Chloroflexi bacterium]|nr:MAG: L-seryl-tRNA selenium transferase [Chloroflexota bacterium]
MGIEAALGVRPLLNAAGPLTRLSGMPLHPEVAQAMAEAATECARIEDLQAAAGRYLAEVSGAEAGYVTTGAAAGLALAAAACMAGFDIAAMDRLPDTRGLRNEIVIQRAHLTAYTHALRLPGASLVEAGYMGYPGQGITWPWQIEAAISERTCAIAYSYGIEQGSIALPEIAAIAHKYNLPVIVDAAAALPPATNLRAFIEQGADLVAFSGGKAIGGPQASGILLGRKDLIESVALQHQDMDVYPQTWTWRERYLANGALPGPPHHGIGRPMKVGKEEIVGLVVALKRFLARDHEAERREQHTRLAAIAAALADLPAARPELPPLSAHGGYPSLQLHLDETLLERSTASVVLALLDDGAPPVAVSQNWLAQSALGINVSALRPEHDQLLIERLRGELMR